MLLGSFGEKKDKEAGRQLRQWNIGDGVLWSMEFCGAVAPRHMSVSFFSPSLNINVFNVYLSPQDLATIQCLMSLNP